MMWWLVRLRLSFSPQTEDIASHLKIWLGHEVVKASSFVVVFGARVLLLCVSGEYTWTMSFSHSSQKLSAPAFPHLSIHDSRVYARIEDVGNSFLISNRRNFRCSHNLELSLLLSILATHTTNLSRESRLNVPPICLRSFWKRHSRSSHPAFKLRLRSHFHYTEPLSIPNLLEQ